ncbi:MAG: DNA-binding response regulator [Chloroflexi bacterium]|nr:MAG: DNA-binding response regulator [Chloroflexota bacterium]
MKQYHVLLIGYKKKQSEPFVVALKKRYRVSIAQSGKQGLAIADSDYPHVIVLDTVVMRTSGERLCDKIAGALPDIPLVYIHEGPDKPRECGADVVLMLPFTPRKLTNAIERLLPKESNNLIHCGPFSIDPQTRMFSAYGREVQLTPKQALLMQIFLQNPGKVFDKKDLMQQVWHTQYVEDTRTLNVHISSVRRAMEAEGRPRLLKTKRGVGYYLDVVDTRANGKRSSKK